jgi:hypothetical protein
MNSKSFLNSLRGTFASPVDNSWKEFVIAELQNWQNELAVNIEIDLEIEIDIGKEISVVDWISAIMLSQ